jgi:integrase
VTLLRRKDGTYEADLQAHGQRVHLSLRTTRKGEASDRYAALRALVRNGPADVLAALRSRRISIAAVAEAHASGQGFAALSQATGRGTAAPWPTLAEASADYVATLHADHRRSDETVRHATRALRIIADHLGGDVRVDAIEPEAAEAFARAVTSGREVAPWTGGQYVIRLRALYTWLAKREAAQARRQQRAPRPLECPLAAEFVPPQPEGRAVFLTREDVRRLLAATPPTLLPLIGLALFAGLRADEIRALRVQDVAGGVVAVVGKPHWLPGRKPWRTKSGKPRYIVAGPWLADVLARATADRTSGWLYPAARNPAHPRDTEWFRAQVMAVVQRAGLPYGQRTADGITLHTLRHTFAAHHVMEGTDLYTLSQLLGHADLTMLQRTYGHLSPDFRARVAGRLEAALISAPNPTGTPTGNRS